VQKQNKLKRVQPIQPPVESEKSMEEIALNPLRATDYTLQVNQTALC
jgi:hypothetical protein